LAGCRENRLAVSTALRAVSVALFIILSKGSSFVQAVILTAGRGRRMEPLSRACHKALLEIGGSTILGRAMDSLLKANVGPITVVTGYRSDDITSFISAAYPGVPVRYVHNERYDTTNNIVSLALALESLTYEEDVILIECDLLFEPHLIADLVKHPGRNVALVDHYRTGMDGTVISVDKGYVNNVYPTSSQGADFRYRNKYKTLNIYRFDREYCQSTLRPMLSAYANNVDSNCYYEIVLGMLANIPEHRISAQVVRDSDWVEVDDPNDLSVARFSFEPTERARVLDRSFGGHWSYDVLDFSLPRNAFFPPGAMHAALGHSLPDVITGYGSCQEILDEKAALFAGCQPGRVHLISGASQAFPVLRHLYQDKTVAIPAPTFGEYARCFPGAVTYEESVAASPQRLGQYAREADLLVVVNPNNPSGITASTQALYDLAAATPATMFLVDESFLAFSGQPSLISLLEDDPLDNVVILTSLGKSLGVPGLRLGYLYTSNAEFRQAFIEFIPVWGVNALAEFFLELTIKFRGDLEKSIALTVAERSRLRRKLTELPFVHEVHESGGNFLLVRLRGRNPAIAAQLRQGLLAGSRIEVKDVSAKYPDRLPRLRLAVRTRPDNDRLLSAMRSLASSSRQEMAG
jgi:histidinol-phosphate/aromatic aminotransferase/cobyric acid decarboxylase-like protein/choline kinase